MQAWVRSRDPTARIWPFTTVLRCDSRVILAFHNTLPVLDEDSPALKGFYNLLGIGEKNTQLNIIQRRLLKQQNV